MNVLEKIVTVNGREKQLRQLQEECAELIVAISHYLRDGNTESEVQVLEEAADVEILFSQLPFVFAEFRESVEEIKAQKLKRLEERIVYGRNL